MKHTLTLLTLVLALLAAHAQEAAKPAAHSILQGTPNWQVVGPAREVEGPAPTLYVDSTKVSSAAPTTKNASFDAVVSADGSEFRLRGEAGEKRSMRWRGSLPAPQTISNTGNPVYLLRYQASGIQREVAAYPVVQLSGKDNLEKPGTIRLLDCHAVINDGRWHTLIGKLTPGFSAEEVQVHLATENSEARVQIAALEVYPDVKSLPPFVAPDAAGARGKEASRFSPVTLDGPSSTNQVSPPLSDNIAAAFDRVLSKHSKVADGLRDCPAGELVVDGVPFVISGGANNLISPPPRADPNEEKVEFLGAQGARKYFFPPSRDDLLSFPLSGRRASEVLLLLVCDMAPVQPRYGLSPSPSRLDDVETFIVELVYADGTSDWAFPYSLADAGCVIARMGGAYAVSADPARPLERVVCHNRLFGVNVSVAGITLNTTSTRLVPSLVEETPPIQPPSLVAPASQPPHLTYRDGLLRGGNTHYEFEVDCRDGFSIRSLSSRWAPQVAWSVDPSSGLEVVLTRRGRALDEANPLAGTSGVSKEVDLGKKVFTGRAFVVGEVEVDQTVATLSLHSARAELPLAITLRLEVDDSPRLATRIEATNRGKEPLATTIRFPVLKDLVIGGSEDSWIFFPQYRALISRDPVFVAALNGPYFSHQFFDAFNPKAGIGLMTLTHNIEQWPIEYSMGKSEAGISCSVAYPGRFHEIAPGQTLKPPGTSLVWHAGDWHQAVGEYQTWLRTWYHARRVTGDWWRRAFVMRSYIVSSVESPRINHTPPIFDRVTGKYRIDEAHAADLKYWEQSPDLAHLFAWYHRDEERNYNWGEYSTPQAYAQAGGLDLFRQAIKHFQDDLHMPVSLYTIGDRCSQGTTAFEQFGEKANLWRAGAAVPPIQTPMGQFRVMCWGYQPWQEHYIADLAKLRRDTGQNIVYMDVFPLQAGNACDCPDHGHERPLWFDRTSHQVLSRTRDALSQEVAIYSEYPMSDVTSQDVDGHVAYYNLPLHRHFDKLCDVPSLDERAAIEAETPFSLHRYVFTEIKQLCFGVGVDGRNLSRLKIPFFNGDAELGVTWYLKPERIRQVTNRGLTIQKRLSDCFTSDRPEPMAPTQRRGVYANRFPGQARTLWTLWNARYQTVRGTVLAVPHHEGATYRDEWNDRDLTPALRDRQAILSLELGPQSIGCISQTLRKP
jgi:hypothetical protein